MRIWILENTHKVKNEGKLSTPQLIMAQHEKTEDPSYHILTICSKCYARFLPSFMDEILSSG